MSFKCFLLLLALWAVAANAQYIYNRGNFEANSRFKLVKGINRFSQTFFNSIIKKLSNENVVCSPLSAHTILSLAAAGAQDLTKQQLHHALCALGNFCAPQQGYAKLLQELKDAENVTVQIATKIYTAKDLALSGFYQKKAKQAFLSEVEEMKGTLAQFVENANKWVDNKTNHKISQLISEDDVSDDTKLILLNAIYFNGKWKYPFDSYTFDEPFYNFDKTNSRASMMMMNNNYLNTGYSSILNADFVELPYKNSDFKMIVIMPNGEEANKDNFDLLGEKLKFYNYENILKTGSLKKIVLTMPRFTVTSTLDLEPVLKDMGMTEMFTSNANFNSMTKYPQNLQVDKVVQKAFISVDEKGSEAAAASGMSIMNRSFSDSLTINKPFYFAIISSQGTLFEGRVISPKYVKA